MKTRLLGRLSAVAMITLTGFAGVASPRDRHADSFRATVSGAVGVTISGKATFGRVAGGPDVFTLSLGTDSSEGAVLFTLANDNRLSVGSYKVSDTGPGRRVIQGLIMLGRSDRPEGVFRVQSGTLTVTSASDHALTGLFSLDAAGFLASSPERENRLVYVSGSFTAHAAD